MTGTDLIPVDQASTFDLVPRAWELAERIARTEFVPSALRGKPDAIMACVLSGHEMGISPLQALSKIHVIEGRPSMSAELMRALVMDHGHEIWVEASTTQKVTVAGQRAGSSHAQRVTWTMDDAQKAGLQGKQNWRKYPRQMLLARASAELVRMMAPDVLAGLSYATEEVEDGFTFGDNEPEADEPTEVSAGNVRKLPAKKAAAKKAAPRKKAAKKAEAQPASAEAERPPLPGEGDDEIIDAEVVEETTVDEAATKRAQQIAMRARDAGVDHHEVVSAITGGSETSAKAIDKATADDVLDALRRLKLGEVVLDTSEDVPRLADPPEGEGGPDLGDVDSWDGEQWRAWLADQGLKVVQTIKAAKQLASASSMEEPGSLDDLASIEGLPVLVAGWVEGEVADRDGGS